MKLLSAAAHAALTAMLAATLSFPTTVRAEEGTNEVTPAEKQEIVALFEADMPKEPILELNPTLTDRQAELVRVSYQQALIDNLPDPKLLPGLLMQETRGGIDPSYKQALNKCYGIFQIKIGTALHVLREYPELVERFKVDVRDQAALKRRLIHDDAFNTAVASKYVIILMKYGYNSVRELAAAYNQGMAGAKKLNPKTFPYSTGVVKHIKDLFGR